MLNFIPFYKRIFLPSVVIFLLYELGLYVVEKIVVLFFLVRVDFKVGIKFVIFLVDLEFLLFLFYKW